MADSSYYRAQMNLLGDRIADKRRRKSTCETVSNNLSGDGSYSGITDNLLSGADYLCDGLFGMDRTPDAAEDVRGDREKVPVLDDHLSAAVDALRREISRLNGEIDSLQQQYDSAQWNYRAAKDREWQETLERLGLR